MVSMNLMERKALANTVRKSINKSPEYVGDAVYNLVCKDKIKDARRYLAKMMVLKSESLDSTVETLKRIESGEETSQTLIQMSPMLEDQLWEQLEAMKQMADAIEFLKTAEAVGLDGLAFAYTAENGVL